MIANEKAETRLRHLSVTVIYEFPNYKITENFEKPFLQETGSIWKNGEIVAYYKRSSGEREIYRHMEAYEQCLH